MSAQVAQTPEQLKRRACYFLFESQRRGRREVADFAKRLYGLGGVVIIGGMLRDLAVAGNAAFTSDVDFVAKPISLREFDRLMRRKGAAINRFGGCRLELNTWKVDVWPLERTWASRAGYRIVCDFPDLLGATFFDWDAVLFDYGQRKVIAASDYFDRLATRIIDVNLHPNPNPTGNAVRALRYAYINKLYFGRRLADHVLQCISNHAWTDLILREQRSFGSSLLRHIDREEVVKRLSTRPETGQGEAIKPIAG